MSSINTPRPHGQWFKSSYSGGTSDQCVEACPQPAMVYVRDSKHKEESGAPMLGFTTAAWSAFAAHAGGDR
ncbi:DUF397 domain-containing protein [Streptomyces sp. NBC_01565]|uniref:DUF397 domain-containing protein n=1 Tax=unclassified Streptomyces TaxID=2593676 RepID=UPI00224EA008|nr:DUF397 domain-containing protein [Streptomyces sp. NBC_01565]MCX4546871.1 DUF397 domain-containing protein [Streptomyces sp. NBC_01565]